MDFRKAFKPKMDQVYTNGEERVRALGRSFSKWEKEREDHYKKHYDARKWFIDRMVVGNTWMMQQIAEQLERGEVPVDKREECINDVFDTINAAIASCVRQHGDASGMVFKNFRELEDDV